MPETLTLLLTCFGALSLLILLLVGLGFLVWHWFPKDGEHSPRICSGIVQTRHGPMPCTHLALPGSTVCRGHAYPQGQ